MLLSFPVYKEYIYELHNDIGVGAANINFQLDMIPTTPEKNASLGISASHKGSSYQATYLKNFPEFPKKHMQNVLRIYSQRSNLLRLVERTTGCC